MAANADVCSSLSNLSAIIDTARALAESAKRKDLEAFSCHADQLCECLSRWDTSRFRMPTPIDDGLAISTIVKHKPRKHPPTTAPREFDTLFFLALLLMELAGMTVTFQWLKDGSKGRYYLRGELSSAAGLRFYVARIILNAAPSRLANFNEDHHSYRLRDLIQRGGGGGMLPDGKLGRKEAVERCSKSYQANATEYHAALSPDEYRKLLIDLLIIATDFHG